MVLHREVTCLQGPLEKPWEAPFMLLATQVYRTPHSSRIRAWAEMAATAPVMADTAMGADSERQGLPAESAGEVRSLAALIVSSLIPRFPQTTRLVELVE